MKELFKEQQQKPLLLYSDLLVQTQRPNSTIPTPNPHNLLQTINKHSKIYRKFKEYC